jgi:hypothetical protein
MRKKGHKLSEQTLLDLFRDIHNNKYQYQPFPDKFSVRTRIGIVCRVHGEYRQSIGHHLGGQGCPKCAHAKRNTENQLGRSEWIRRFESVHGRGKYDYSRIPENMKQGDKLAIYCPEHDVTFYQTTNQHWQRQQGCPKCGILKKRETQKSDAISRREYELRARAVHGLRFEYSELPLEFSLNDTIIIYCSEHAHAFFCAARDHLNGKGCGIE